jgi:hypothetical protein
MLVLRSILFSFAILWRMAVVMPFVALALAVFSGMLAVWFVGFMMYAPLIAWQLLRAIANYPEVVFISIIVVMSATMSVVPMMVGARLGLQARGIMVRDGYGKMILPALGYGFFEFLLSMLMLAFGFGLFMLQSPLTLADLGQLVESGTSLQWATAFEQSSTGLMMILGGFGIVTVAVRAGLLMPIAGASIGRDANGSTHTPFMGFGTRYLSSLAVVLMAGVAVYFMVPALDIFADAIGLSLQGPNETPVDGETWKQWALAVAAVLWMLWVFSLQCSVGVLAYLDQKDVYEEIANEQEQDKRMAAEEVRGLWKERMPPGRR